jgi:Holliday junction resolvase RusA-like endonuclease
MASPIINADIISFCAYCTPEPQGSMRAFIPKGHTRPIITSDNKDLKSYRQEVAKAALAERNKIGIYGIIFGKHVPVAATFEFYFAKPESVSKKRTENVVRPDVSKLIRATEDALTGIIYLDDAQIIEEHAFKFYGLPERVEIKIEGKFTDTPQSLFVTHEDDF